MLSRLERIISGEEQPPPVAKLLGVRLVSAAPGETVFELDVDERFSNPMGTLHGGILCDLADLAMGSAYASLLGEGESFTTIELKINFLKPVWSGRLQARGHLVKAGQTLGLTECDVTDEQGSLVARASSTCMTLRDRNAQGR